MPNLKDKPRQTAPVPSNYLIMLVDPITGATKGMPILEFLGSQISPDTTPPTIISKTAINATTIRIIFDEIIGAGSILGWSAKKNGTNNPILSVTGLGTGTLDFVVQNSMISSDTILISYNPATGATADSSSNEVVAITDSAVTNSISGGGGGDVTAPTVVSATVLNADPDTIVVVFSESVSGVSATGWSFKKNGSAWAISSVTGSGTTWNFNMATAAVNGDTLLRSYNSGTGATVDGSSNELVSFTDSAVTNSIAGSSITYLTFPSFPSGFEAYNSNKGVRTTAGFTEAWTGIVANQVLTVGQRMVVKTDGIAKFSFFGISQDGTTSGGWSPNTGGRQTDESKIEASNLDTAFNEAINDNYFYSVLYESEDNASPADNGVVRLQKSADGINWTTIASATSTPFTGNLNMKIFIYSANHGFSEIYKI
jgi:hypothetical protein